MVKEWNSYQSMSTDSNVSTTASASQLSTLVWHQHLHKYTAHRRSILAAATFDIAALLALSQFSYHQANTSGRARSTLALTITLFSTTGRSTYPRLRVTSEQTENKSHHVLRVWANPEVLEDLCDLSFLIGSLMDSMLDDVRVSAHFDTWAIVSSLLWLIDACLYLQSNFVMASRVKKSHDIKSDSCFVWRGGDAFLWQTYMEFQFFIWWPRVQLG